MREQAITDLFKEVNDIIGHLESIESRAANDASITSLWNPKVKSAFEHLRTVLDYSTHDIQDTLSAIKKNKGETFKEIDVLYFPYGKDENILKEKFKKNLPTLKNDLPDVAALITSIQSFKTGTNWLTFFISSTNKMKHFDEAKQTRVDSNAVSVNGAIRIEISKNGPPNNDFLKITNSTLNGVLVNGEVTTGNGKITSAPDNVTLIESDMTEFVFSESNEYIIKIIKQTYSGISNYIDKLYPLLLNHH